MQPDQRFHRLGAVNCLVRPAAAARGARYTVAKDARRGDPCLKPTGNPGNFGQDAREGDNEVPTTRELRLKLPLLRRKAMMGRFLFGFAVLAAAGHVASAAQLLNDRPKWIRLSRGSRSQPPPYLLT